VASESVAAVPNVPSARPSSTVTRLGLPLPTRLATSRSSRPSPLKSPSASWGKEEVGTAVLLSGRKTDGGANGTFAVAAPAGAGPVTSGSASTSR
jgi:hypothetical protein